MSKKLLGVLLTLSALSLLGQLLLYPSLPYLVPTHWNLYGQVDGWGPRPFQIVLAALPLGFTLLFFFLPHLDPRRKNYRKHTKAYGVFSAAAVGVFMGVSWIIVLYALGLRLPLSNALLCLMGVLFIILGNYMPQIRPNYFVGIKTPWALANDTVWRKTHRLGGAMFCLCGAAFVLCGILWGRLPGWFAATLLVLVLVIPFLYSYLVYRKLEKTEDPHAED